MKILITSLLLFIGLSQVLARSLPWLRLNNDGFGGWLYDEDDMYGLPENIFNIELDGSSEESKELVRADGSIPRYGGFGTLLDSFLENEETDAKSKENTQNKSSEEKQNNDNDDDDDDRDDGAGKLLSNFLAVLLSDENGANENESSEESKVLYRKNDGSSEDSDEVAHALEVAIFDLTKSSEEKPADNEAEEKSFEDNSNEATEITDMIKTSQEYKTPETKDDADEEKEVEEILNILSFVVGAILEEELGTNQVDINAEADDQIFKTITDKNESVTEDDSSEETTTISTIPSTDSHEDNNEDNKSSSGDNDSDLVYVVLKGIDEDDKQQTLNEHKYSIINSQQELVPTSAPHLLEDTAVSLSSTDVQSSIDEYVRIRENLDNQQDSLKKLQYDLDKDFYAIISNNPDDNTLNKFEKDIYAVQENLDQIRKNVNAMQNLQTKLYFHKLVATAVEEVKNESKN